MRSDITSFIAAAVVASSFSVEALASTVPYTQAPNGSVADTSAVANISGDPGFTWTLDGDSEAWAYFTAATNASFNRISWYGSDADGKFAVDFFSAACFSCGANWVETSGKFTNSLLPNPGPFSQTGVLPDVHKTLMSGSLGTYGSLYSYYIDLASPLTLTKDSTYALSVVNNYTSSPFYWAASDAGSGTHLHYIVGQAMFLGAPGNLAFTLTDTTVAAIPEPETYTMMLAGLGMLGFVARRRK